MNTWENNMNLGIRSADVSQTNYNNVGKQVTKNKMSDLSFTKSNNSCKAPSSEPFTNITFSASQNSSSGPSANCVDGIGGSKLDIKVDPDLISPPGGEDEENTSPVETPKRAKLSKPSSRDSHTHSLFSLNSVLEDSLVNECTTYRHTSTAPAVSEIHAKSIYCKPPYSYSFLIILALKNSKHGYLPVTDIYTFVRNHFPFYETATEVWKNSIRHNLSLSKGFEKVARYNPEAPSSRKGCLWAINPDKIPKADEELARIRGKDPQSILRSMRYPDKLNVIESGCQGFGGIVDSFKSQYGMTTFASYIRLFMKEALTQEPCIQLETDHWSNVSLPEKPVSIHGVYVPSSQPTSKSLPPVQSFEQVLPLCNEPRRPTNDFKANKGNTSHVLQPAGISYHYNISPTPALTSNIPVMHPVSVSHAFRNFSPTAPHPPIANVSNVNITSGSSAPLGSLVTTNKAISSDLIQQQAANCDALYPRRYPGLEQTPRAPRFQGNQGSYYANPHLVTSPLNELHSSGAYHCGPNQVFLPPQHAHNLFHPNKVLVDPVVKLPPPNDSPFSSPPCFDPNRTPSTHSVVSSHHGLASTEVSPFATSNFNSEFDPIFGDIVHENFNNLYSPYIQ